MEERHAPHGFWEKRRWDVGEMSWLHISKGSAGSWEFGAHLWEAKTPGTSEKVSRGTRAQGGEAVEDVRRVWRDRGDQSPSSGLQGWESGGGGQLKLQARLLGAWLCWCLSPPRASFTKLLARKPQSFGKLTPQGYP